MAWETSSLLPLVAEALDPVSRMTAELQERGGSYAYTAPGWSAYKGVVAKTSSHAAVSALTLLSFLFFLNLLQQQLSSGQQQTLLFMVNNTAPVNREGRRMKRSQNATFLEKEAAAVKKQWRDLLGSALHAKIFLESNSATVPSVPVLMEPSPLAAPPTEELTPPVMMEGLSQDSALQLSAWFKGQLSADELTADLADTLTNCRAAVACTLHRDSNNHKSNEQSVRKLLNEAGEFAEVGRVEEACEALLLSTVEDCSTLARAFSILLN